MENILHYLQHLPCSIRKFDPDGKLVEERNNENRPMVSPEAGQDIKEFVGRKSHPELRRMLKVADDSRGNWSGAVLHDTSGEQKRFFFFRGEEDSGFLVIDFPLVLPDVEVVHYETLIDNIPGIDMFLIDEDQSVLIAVGHEIKRNEWTRGHFPSGKIREILQGKLLDILDVLLPLVAKGTPVFREFSQKKQYFSLRLIPVFTNGNEVKYTIIFLQNVTTAKRTEIRLRKSIRSVEEAHKAKNAFISHMSHEIRTPLNAILGFAEQLEKTRLSKTQLRYLDILKNSSQHLLSIVNDVLTLSKFEAGKLHFEEYPFSVSEVVQTIRQVVEMRYQKEGIEFRLLMDPVLEEKLIGDAGRLRQVLMNLINNAMKFTAKGHVELRCTVIERTEENMSVRFEVCDTGIGIQKNKLDLIFEPFRQLDSSLKRKYSGTGLGLTICKSLIESQGGKIGVESEAGKGSTFNVELTYTLAGEEDKKKDEIDTGQEEVTFTGKNVMIVDDDPVNCLLAEIMLKNVGIRPVVADGGEQAIKFYSPGRFDMILLDIQMPNVSGIDVVRHIRAMEKGLATHTIVLAMTANVLKQDIDRYTAEGMDGHLIKPFTEERLLYYLRRFLHYSWKEQAKDGSGLVNLDDLLSTTKGDSEFTLLMLNTFEQNTLSQIKRLKNAVNTGNIQKTAEVAHRMIPSCEHLGAVKVAGKLKRLEHSCRDKNDVDLEEVRKEAEIIDQHLRAILEEVRKIKKQYQI